MVSQTIFSNDLIILEIVFRLLLALFIGFAIGFERKMRFKEAGIRTHTIVSIGSCLFTVISMYAFEGADAARVAAQIVPGIGFLGAGMIFHNKEMIHGLTTAAGIWATAAIGMAAGVGWYLVAAVATVLIILIQCIMHTKFKIFHAHRFVKVNLVYKEDGDVTERIKEIFCVDRFVKINAKKENGEIIFSTVLTTDKILTAKEIQKLLEDNPSILTIARQDEDF